MKKLLSLILAVCLVLGMASFAELRYRLHDPDERDGRDFHLHLPAVF